MQCSKLCARLLQALNSEEKITDTNFNYNTLWSHHCVPLSLGQMRVPAHFLQLALPLQERSTAWGNTRGIISIQTRILINTIYIHRSTDHVIRTDRVTRVTVIKFPNLLPSSLPPALRTLQSAIPDLKSCRDSCAWWAGDWCTESFWSCDHGSERGGAPGNETKIVGV